MMFLKVGSNREIRRTLLVAGLLSTSTFALAASPASAQDSDPEPDVADGNTIIVTGIRASLQSALAEQRNADSLVEVIQAEDIGKLPDQNLAEVLENVTGVQITRTAGVGTGVQIRGSNDNRTEINGVGTVGSGSGRGGISFEDVNAAIISSVEVTKAPTAATTEGAVGGTVNLRTIRPLDLRDMLLSARVQGEYSELTGGVTPRFSGSFGNSWDTGAGRIGVVLAGSYAKQDATSFRPRVDRDTLVSANSAVTADGQPGPNFDFLGIQFLNQELEEFKYETINLAGSVEWAPSDNIKVFFDGFYNDQERRQESSRVQASGVSTLRFNNVPSAFETVDFGTLDGVDLGSIEAAQVGVIEANLGVDNEDPNLRFSSDTGARLTETYLMRGGLEYTFDRLSVRAEVSRTSSKSSSPNLSTTLNFINPNGFPLVNNQNENNTPFAYDLSNNALTFGINFDSPQAPTIDQLLDPANVLLDAVTVGNNRTENGETAARLDLSYDTYDSIGFITSVDVGYRYNKSSTQFDQNRATFSTGALDRSPNGLAFADLLVPGKSTFGDFDGRELAFRNFLVIDQNMAFTDQAGTLAALQAALAGTPVGIARAAAGEDPLLTAPIYDPIASYRVNETTHALYAQANFEFGPVRGNIGARYIDTKINSIGNTSSNGVISEVSTPGNYTQFMPRVNIVADVTDSLVLRASWTEDLNRPNFDFLKTSVSFPTGPNNAVLIGNPALEPETVTSFDASLSWYFAPSAVLSIGAFHKTRTNLFVEREEAAVEDANGYRDITPPCEGGGIFNPVPDRNVLSDVPGNGLCVPIRTSVNDTGSTIQRGIEVAFQYDLSAFEDTLGFASGFGLIANYTYQEFSGGEALDTSDADSRGTAILEASSGLVGPFTAPRGLLDFSPHAYNVTLFYEKYGLSARARYTWRDAFRTLDTAGGASLGSTIGFPVTTAARGQLNASINYDLTENINIGLEGVNLTKSKIEQYCVNDGGLLCFQGLPDRRLVAGASVTF